MNPVIIEPEPTKLKPVVPDVTEIVVVDHKVENKIEDTYKEDYIYQDEPEDDLYFENPDEDVIPEFYVDKETEMLMVAALANAEKNFINKIE